MARRKTNAALGLAEESAALIMLKYVLRLIYSLLGKAQKPNVMPFAIPTPINGQIPVLVNPSHRCFDSLVTAEAGIAGYMLGYLQQAGTQSPHGLRLLHGPMRHVCFVEQAEIECNVNPILADIGTLSWPTSIQLIASTIPQSTSSPRTSNPDGIQRLTGSIHAHAFLTYYENIKSEIKSHHGNNPEHWPEILKFARMTRNSFGHGGILDIRNPNATASWRGLTLTQANNGEQMLYNHIASGDVVLLMLDVEDMLT